MDLADQQAHAPHQIQRFDHGLLRHLVEQNAASAMALQAQAQTVSETVQVFRLDATGRSPAAAGDAVALRRSMKAQAQSQSRSQVQSPPQMRPRQRSAPGYWSGRRWSR